MKRYMNAALLYAVLAMAGGKPDAAAAPAGKQPGFSCRHQAWTAV